MKKKIKPKLKKYSDGGKEIKKAENFFKRENKKNPERFGEHYAKDKNILSDLSKKQNGGKLPKRKLNLKKSNSDWEIIG